MAGFNPFRGFRKHQKVALAVVGVGAMLSFIVVPSLMQLFSGVSSSHPSDEVIAKTRRFGSVNRMTLQNLQDEREHLGRFYAVLYQHLADPSNQNTMMMLQYLEMTARQYSSRSSAESLVNNWLLAQYAKDKGMSVNKKAVVSHLSQLTGGLLSDKAFRDTLQAVGMNEQRLEYLIGLEILSNQMQSFFDVSQRTASPSMRWDWFQRLNRQMTVEVAAVNVDDMLEQVPAPSDAELRKFFEERKETIYNPTAVDSGFTIPNQIAFEHIRAVPSQKLLDAVTQEEIEKYYEANKESMFRRPVKPIGERPNLPGMDPGSMFRSGLGGFTPGGASSSPFPAPRRPEESATPSPAPEEEPKTEPKPEEPKSEEPGTVPPVRDETPKTEAKPEEPATPAPAPEEEPKTEPKPEEPKPAEPEMSHIRHRTVTTRFVSYQTEKEAEPGTQSPAREETPKADEPVDLSILFKPLSEVEKEIRETLAQQKVDQVLAQIESKMRDYFHAFNLSSDADQPAPPRPDFAAMAAEQGLVLENFALDTIFALLKEDIIRGSKEREFLIQQFQETPILFEPKFFDGDESRYLFWVTESTPQHRPENFEEVKDTVLKRWKEVQARPLAQKRAEELAAQAKTSGKSLAETFATQQNISVVETEPFSWKTYGSGVYAAMLAYQNIPPRLSEVREKGVAVGNAELDNKVVFAPGESFMETVSALQVGEIATVFNRPQNMVYVVRLIGSSPSEEALWDRYQNTSFVEYRLAGQMEYVQEAFEAWIGTIREESGFKWINKPEPIGR